MFKREKSLKKVHNGTAEDRMQLNFLERIFCYVVYDEFFGNVLYYLKRSFLEMIEPLGVFIANVFCTIFFPITIIINTYLGLKDDKKTVERHKKGLL